VLKSCGEAVDVEGAQAVGNVLNYCGGILAGHALRSLGEGGWSGEVVPGCRWLGRAFWAAG